MGINHLTVHTRSIYGLKGTPLEDRFVYYPVDYPCTSFRELLLSKALTCGGHTNCDVELEDGFFKVKAELVEYVNGELEKARSVCHLGNPNGLGGLLGLLAPVLYEDAAGVDTLGRNVVVPDA